MKHRRQRRALRDQLGLGLLDQLVLVDFEKIQAEDWQQQHAGQHEKDDQAQRRPPLPARGFVNAPPRSTRA
jgi:hypothetical protein